MTVLELKQFYNGDNRLYDLKNNKDFLYTFNSFINKGYDLFIGVNEMQEMIDLIANWYEIKYPEREFDFYDENITSDFDGLFELSSVMNIKQLLFRLTDNQKKLLEGLYRSQSSNETPIYQNGEITGVNKKVYFRVIRNANDRFFSKYKSFMVSVDANSGLVDMDYELEKYVLDDKIYLNDLVKIFESKYSDELDFSEIQEADNNKRVDNYLRDTLLELVSLKLLYSRRTTPERGYERARRFICEFNKKLNLNLNTDLIDEAINRDYGTLVNNIRRKTYYF